MKILKNVCNWFVNNKLSILADEIKSMPYASLKKKIV